MQKFKFSKKEKIFLGLALAVILMLFISSSMTYHEQKIQPGFADRHLHFLEDWFASFNIYYGGRWHNLQHDGKAGLTEFILRKLAHFTSFFFLGSFLYLGFRRIFKIKYWAPIFCWLLTVGLAAFDEYHQYLTGDRTPSVHDVMLDGTGAFCGIIFVWLILKLLVIYRQKRAKQDSAY